MKKTLLRHAAALLALLLVLICAVSCSGSGKALLRLEKDGVSVSLSENIYELMLTRIKGSLAGSGFSVNDEKFWAQTDKYNGTDLQTLDEYYRDCILDNCRTYLAALWLFDSNGLTLSGEALDAVDGMMDELLRTDGDGSKTKLNSVLSAYGVNSAMLREAYEIDAKIAAVKAHYYGKDGSLLGDTVKTEYLNENYLHFRQIFLASYEYVYETDKNGDTVYYFADVNKSNRICYDTFNGEPDAEKTKDANGDTVYYVKGSDFKKIAYDAINGIPRNVTEADGSTYRTKQMDETGLKALREKADGLLNDLKNADAATFEAAVAKYSEDTADETEYSDGVYLRLDTNYTNAGEDYAYLDSIVEAIGSAEVGTVTMVQSGFGYHILMKYAPTEKAYSDAANEVWFKDFNTRLVDELFLEKCKGLYSDIVLDEGRYENAPRMRDVAVNYYY